MNDEVRENNIIIQTKRRLWINQALWKINISKQYKIIMVLIRIIAISYLHSNYIEQE